MGVAGSSREIVLYKRQVWEPEACLLSGIQKCPLLGGCLIACSM